MGKNKFSLLTVQIEKNRLRIPGCLDFSQSILFFKNGNTHIERFNSKGYTWK